MDTLQHLHFHIMRAVVLGLIITTAIITFIKACAFKLIFKNDVINRKKLMYIGIANLLIIIGLAA